MAIYLMTATPKKLLSSFKKAIDDGQVDTWTYDEDGDFTHTPPQWRNKAWLRPSIIEGSYLALYTVPRNDASITWPVYAVYQGRFIESMIEHCHDLFSQARATPSPATADRVS
jgi:hypothetical protein